MLPDMPKLLVPILVAATAACADPQEPGDAPLSPGPSLATAGCPTPSLTGSVLLLPEDPASAATLRSDNSDVPTAIEFANATCEAVSIYWIDFTGQRVFYSSLQPGQSYVQPTYITHPWVVVGSSSGDLAVYEPVASVGTAYVQKSYRIRRPPRCTIDGIPTGCVGGVRG